VSGIRRVHTRPDFWSPTFLTLKSFLPGMKERGRGAIITVASLAGQPGRDAAAG
jgi:short-subunit dehydrogenase